MSPAVPPRQARFSFGRHLGVDVSLCPDTRYLAWLMTQNWPRVKYPALYAAARDELVRRLAAEAQLRAADVEEAARWGPSTPPVHVHPSVADLI